MIYREIRVSASVKPHTRPRNICPWAEYGFALTNETSYVFEFVLALRAWCRQRLGGYIEVRASCALELDGGTDVCG